MQRTTGDDTVTVYTCITDGYDHVSDLPAVREDGVRFVCYSNGSGAPPDGWEAHRLVAPRRLADGHYVNRYHKMFPHHLFPDSRHTVYLDGHVRYQGRFRVLVEQIHSAGAGLGVFRHPDGRSLRAEADACRRLRKFDTFDLARVDDQLRTYATEGLDLDQPIGAHGLIVRDHVHPLLPVTMSLWWSQLFEFTKRDQMSLVYAAWKSELPWIFLDDASDVHAADLTWVSHRRSVWCKITDRLRRIRDRTRDRDAHVR